MLRHEGVPFDVLPGESLLTILAFRGGTLASAGHNHVIASHDLNGTLYVPRDPTRATLQIRIPVALLKIDEATLRAPQGAGFPPNVPESAKQGTRRNMLGAAVLDVADYPDIVLSCEHLQPLTDAVTLRAQVQVSVRGHTHTISVPVRYTLQNDRITASGELPIRQSELGLTPFSTLLGALQVQDELQVKFRIVARAATLRGS
ncbi:MAG TPA: YceI family protein [Steroidobacteraceae bacterium]